MEERHYRILHVGLSLVSDTPEFLELFEQNFSYFRVAEAGTEKLAVRAIFCGEPAALYVGSQVLSLAGVEKPYAYVYHTLINSLCGRWHDFLVLHAGVVVQQGQAVVLAGPPAVGKTTMVERLLAHGCRFFSDDFCPIERKRKLVHPFPRSLWVCRNDKSGDMTQATFHGNKTAMPVTQVATSVGGAPCPLRCIICLDPGAREARDILEVNLRPGGQAFVEEVRQIADVTLQNPRPDCWHIAYPRELTGRLRSLCQQHQQHIWHAYRAYPVCRDFNREPMLTRMSGHEAALELLQHVKQEATLDDGSPLPLFMELLEMVAGVACYRLTVGKLETMEKMVLYAH
jgi:hypothetical protein